MSSRIRFQVDRIAFFSDAVFAIAMTLMVIEVRPPHITGEFSNKDALMALARLLPLFTGVMLSFVFIGVFWVRHHQIMKHVENYTPKFIRLNIAFLLSIVFIPFSTAFVFENIRSFSNVPLIVYNVNYIVAALMNYWLFAYTLNPANGITAPDSPHRIDHHRFELLYPLAVYAFVILISFFSVPFAGTGYAAFALEGVMERRKKEKLVPEL
jgi:uncharacterized membrane protein